VSLESLARRAGSSHASLTGEVAFDPDFVTFGSLQERAGRAEFVFERRVGSSLS